MCHDEYVLSRLAIFRAMRVVESHNGCHVNLWKHCAHLQVPQGQNLRLRTQCLSVLGTACRASPCCISAIGQEALTGGLICFVDRPTQILCVPQGLACLGGQWWEFQTFLGFRGGLFCPGMRGICGSGMASRVFLRGGCHALLVLNQQILRNS